MALHWYSGARNWFVQSLLQSRQEGIKTRIRSPPSLAASPPVQGQCRNSSSSSSSSSTTTILSFPSSASVPVLMLPRNPSTGIINRSKISIQQENTFCSESVAGVKSSHKGLSITVTPAGKIKKNYIYICIIMVHQNCHI